MEPEEWQGLLAGVRGNTTPLEVRAIIRAAETDTAASPFLALCSDGQEWWVKSPSPRLTKATVTELVVGRLGALIDAPVCTAAPVRISEALLPHEIRPGRPLYAGVGSATKGLPGTLVEVRAELTRRYDDSNRVRHAGIYALVDWCFGSDLQWLQRVDADWETHSHDHGWYLPPSGPDWTRHSLLTHVDVPCPVPTDPIGLDVDELERLADALDRVARSDLLGVMASVPADMRVDDRDLEALGWFMERRAPQVASRLRRLGGVS